VTVGIQQEPGVIVEVRLSKEALRMLRTRYHVRDTDDPVEMGLAVTRLLKEEAQRRRNDAQQQE
jgi:hypothetical protein